MLQKNTLKKCLEMLDFFIEMPNEIKQIPNYQYKNTLTVYAYFKASNVLSQYANLQSLVLAVKCSTL